MAESGEQPEIKPSSPFVIAMGFFTLLVLWAVIGVPIFAGIRAVAGDGGRSDLLCLVATGAIIAGSLLAMSQLESADWRSVEQRQMVYLWTHIIIWGAALLLFWPKG